MTNIIDLTKTSGAKPVTSIESPLGGTPQPAPEVDASEANLESRVNTRRAELIFKLTELRASLHLDAVEAGDRVKARLSELSHIVKEGVVDGWGNLGDTVKRKLDRWLDDSARQLVAQPKSGQS
ncbi:MAG TPA: hypothetical protein VFD36_08360 [Kofleriaceae bacterium]|nr:hypothetical protein [Kofleriaceae bacterium]